MNGSTSAANLTVSYLSQTPAPACTLSPAGIELNDRGLPVAKCHLQRHRLLLQLRQGGPTTQQRPCCHCQSQYHGCACSQAAVHWASRTVNVAVVLLPGLLLCVIV